MSLTLFHTLKNSRKSIGILAPKFSAFAAIAFKESAQLLDSLNPESISKLTAFASRTGVTFKNYNVMVDALTHSSFAAKTEETGRYQLLGIFLKLYIREKGA
jgi:hypothetical protein